MSDQSFPPGWNEERVQRLLAHYTEMSDDALLAEDEAALEDNQQALVIVPVELVPAVRELIARNVHH